MEDRLSQRIDAFSQRIDALSQHVDDVEARLIESIHDSETRLLRAFSDYHVGWDNRFKRIEVSDITIVERLAALENRVLRLETEPR